MKYCNKCGAPLAEGVKFCTGCGNKIEQQVKKDVTNNITSPEEDKSANKLGIISICMYIGGPVLSYVFSFLTTIFTIALDNSMASLISTLVMSLGVFAIRLTSYVLMIIMRVKYPNNKFGKILMWVYIGLLLARVLVIVLIVILLLFIYYQMKQSSLVY